MLGMVYYDMLRKQSGQKQDISVHDYFRLVMDMAEAAGKEGLLAIEDLITPYIRVTEEQRDSFYGRCIYYKAGGLDRLLLFMADGILSGTAPEELETAASERYFISGFAGKEAIAAYIIIKGLLLIQAGRKPEMIEKELSSLLPEEDEDRYLEHKLRIDKKTGCSVRRVFIPDEFFSPEPAEIPVMTSALNGHVMNADEDALKRLLEETDNAVLAIALAGLPGKARKRIFGCLSDRMQGLVYEEYKIVAEDISGKDIIAAAGEMLHAAEAGNAVE